MRPWLLLMVVALGGDLCEAKKQPLRLKQSDSQRERPPPPNSMYAAMEDFHRQRTGQLGQMDEKQLEGRLRQAHVPEDVMSDIRKAQYLSRRGRVRLAPKEAMVDALMSIEDTSDAVRSKPLSALVVWARRAGAPTTAVTGALSAGNAVEDARAALVAVGAGSTLSRSSSTTTLSAEVLASDAERLLSLVPPAARDAARLYTSAAELCASGAELNRLNSQHSALAAEAKKSPDFPRAQGIDQAQQERKKNKKAREDAKTVLELDGSGLSQVLARTTGGSTRGVVIVMFYANWCSHCIDTLPVFAAAKQILATTKQADVLVQVDVAKHKELVQKYDVKAFPTIRAFLQGQAIGPPYAGLRDADDMARWAREIIANPPAPDKPSFESNNRHGGPEAGTPATARKRRSPEQREELLQDEKLANAVRNIGKRMADRAQKRTGDEDSDEPEGPDDPDGLDEGWFPMGKRNRDKPIGDSEPDASTIDPLYRHAEEF